MAVAPLVRRVYTQVGVLNRPGGEVWRYARRLATETMVIAIPLTPGPGRTGLLSKSHSVYTVPMGSLGVVSGVRNTRYYSRWVHEGTGIYGKHATPIVPRNGGWLAFKTKGRRKTVVRSVKGQRPQPWLEQALEIMAARHPGVHTVG